MRNFGTDRAPVSRDIVDSCRAHHTVFMVRNRDDLLVALTMSDDYSSATVARERRDPLFKTPTSVALAADGRLLVANAEYFNSDGAPYYVVNVNRP